MYKMFSTKFLKLKNIAFLFYTVLFYTVMQCPLVIVSCTTCLSQNMIEYYVIFSHGPEFKFMHLQQTTFIYISVGKHLHSFTISCRKVKI